MPSIWRRILVALVVLSITLVLVGCGGPKLPDGKYDIEGEIEAMNFDSKTITIRYDDIPGGPPGGVAEFRVEDPDLLEDLGQGNEVIGRFRVRKGKYILIDLRRKPTPLELGVQP